MSVLRGGMSEMAPFPNESFITISDLSLRTQPSQLPPPSRPPPPPLDVKMRDSCRFTPNCDGVSSEGKSGESSPPYFDVEVDASSSASASTIAIKEAMEKAQAILQSAKELMDRKRDVSVTKDAHGYGRTKEKKVKKNVNMAAKSSEENYRRESFSSQDSDKVNGSGEWTYTGNFFELVRMDESRTALGQLNNENICIVEALKMQQANGKKVKAVRADYGLEEYPEKPKEACVWEENNGRSEVAEVAHRQKRVEKVQLAQEVCRRDESDKKVRINNHVVEYGKRQTRENEQEAAFESANVQIFGKNGESTTLAGGERGKVIIWSQVAFDQESGMVNVMSNRIVRESIDSATKVDAAQLAVLQVKGSNQRTTQQVHESQSIERKVKTLNDNHSLEEKEAEKVKKEKLLEMERLRKMEEQREREKEREKDRMVVDRAALEACERAYRDKPSMGARRRAERAAVERAFAETRVCAFEKAMATKCFNSGMRPSASSPQLQASGSFTGSRYPYPAVNGSYHEERSEGVEGESAQRCKARLERHRRTSERAAKALAEKNMLDLLAQREQAERNRLAETLDADVKRWSSGKEGNLRPLLSTLQYILGPDSGWHPVLLKEVIESAAIKRAYRKAILFVHPDKLQQ